MAITNKQRLDLIESYIRENKYADLHTLSTTFKTSLSTIRRALNDLEAQGIIRRHHGGASLIEDDVGGGYDFITQDDTNVAEKHQLAETVDGMVQDGMTVMLDGGTTTYAIAKVLLRKRLVVITNSLPIAALLNEVSACETIVTGGNIYNRLGVLYGPTCESVIGEMHADLAFIGCGGITADGIWNSNPMLASYQQKMVLASGFAWFVADGSKFNKRALTLAVRFGPGMGLLTTKAPPPELARRIEESGSQLKIC